MKTNTFLVSCLFSGLFIGCGQNSMDLNVNGDVKVKAEVTTKTATESPTVVEVAVTSPVVSPTPTEAPLAALRTLSAKVDSEEITTAPILSETDSIISSIVMPEVIPTATPEPIVPDLTPTAIATPEPIIPTIICEVEAKNNNQKFLFKFWNTVNDSQYVEFSVPALTPHFNSMMNTQSLAFSRTNAGEVNLDDLLQEKTNSFAFWVSQKLLEDTFYNFDCAVKGTTEKVPSATWY
jgi:hypothetical protein